MKATHTYGATERIELAKRAKTERNKQKILHIAEP
jgi:hypothetical protein